MKRFWAVLIAVLMTAPVSGCRDMTAPDADSQLAFRSNSQDTIWTYGDTSGAPYHPSCGMTGCVVNCLQTWSPICDEIFGPEFPTPIEGGGHGGGGGGGGGSGEGGGSPPPNTFEDFYNALFINSNTLNGGKVTEASLQAILESAVSCEPMPQCKATLQGLIQDIAAGGAQVTQQQREKLEALARHILERTVFWTSAYSTPMIWELRSKGPNTGIPAFAVSGMPSIGAMVGATYSWQAPVHPLNILLGAAIPFSPTGNFAGLRLYLGVEGTWNTTQQNLLIHGITVGVGGDVTLGVPAPPDVVKFSWTVKIPIEKQQSPVPPPRMVAKPRR